MKEESYTRILGERKVVQRLFEELLDNLSDRGLAYFCPIIKES